MKPATPFIERIKHGPILADGAMGTMLHQAGTRLDACFDELNVSHPDRVLTIHKVFVEVGADLIETNTFSANRFKLAAHGHEDQVTAFNEAAVKLARQAIRELDGKRDVYVAGAVGPLGARLAPYGRVQPEQAFEAFKEQMSALAKAGIDE